MYTDAWREGGHMATKPHGKDYHVTPEAEAVKTQYRPRIPKVTFTPGQGKRQRGRDESLRGGMTLA